MKEPRWTVKYKGNPYIIKHFKYRWMAKLYVVFRCGKYSITYERIYLK